MRREDSQREVQLPAEDRVPAGGERHEGLQHRARHQADRRGQRGPARPRPHGTHGERRPQELSPQPPPGLGEQPAQPPRAHAGGRAADGAGHRGRDELPQRQEDRAPRPGRQELHGLQQRRRQGRRLRDGARHLRDRVLPQAGPRPPARPLDGAGVDKGGWLL